MSIHKTSMSLLQEIYDIYLTAQPYNINRETYFALSNDERNELDTHIQYLKSSKYIKPHTLCVGLPVSYMITSTGIREIEGIHADNSNSIYNVIYGNNYGVNAHTATGNTIRQGISLSEVTTLIENTVSSKDEQKEILNAISGLFDRIEKGYPIERGLLAQAKGSLENIKPY